MCNYHYATGVHPLGAMRFKRFSSWSSLRHSIAVLTTKLRLFKERNNDVKPSQSKPVQCLSPEVINQGYQGLMSVSHTIHLFTDDR